MFSKEKYIIKRRLNAKTSPQNFWSIFLENDDRTKKEKHSGKGIAITCATELFFSWAANYPRSITGRTTSAREMGIKWFDSFFLENGETERKKKSTVAYGIVIPLPRRFPKKWTKPFYSISRTYGSPGGTPSVISHHPSLKGSRFPQMNENRFLHLWLISKSE